MLFRPILFFLILLFFEMHSPAVWAKEQIETQTVSAISLNQATEPIQAQAPVTLQFSDGAAIELATNAAITTPGCSAVGAHKAIVVPVNYLDDNIETTTKEQIDNVVFGSSGAIASLADYYNKVSYGTATLNGITMPWQTLGINKSEACDASSVRQKVLDRLGPTIDLTQYNRLVIVVRDPQCFWDGLALGCATQQIITPGGGTATIDISTSLYKAYYFLDEIGGTAIMVHETGHNMGLPHELFRDYGDGPTEILGPIGGYSQGVIPAPPLDPVAKFSPMAGGGLSHYNAPHKYEMGWLTNTDIHLVNTTSIVNIQGMAIPAGSLSPGIRSAARIFRGVDTFNYSKSNIDSLAKEYFWVETKKDLGYDSYLFGNEPNQPGPQNGFETAIFYLEHGGSSLVERIELIDMHPGSSGLPGDQWDAPLQYLETFTDPYTGIQIQYSEKFPNTAPDYITLNITYPPQIIDSDEDGITDAAESNFGTDPQMSDTDGDGLTDLWEICYDGDCTSYSPFPSGNDLNVLISDTDNDGMDDSVEISKGRNPLVNDGFVMGMIDLLLLQGKDLCRVDSDGDLLTDCFEQFIGTNAESADTDGDGLTDYFEVCYDGSCSGYKPFPSGNDLNANNTDTDGDGVTDSNEVNGSRNPLQNIDTDGDGLSDDFEVCFDGNCAGYDPFDAATNPTGTDLNVDVWDTDGDGLEDGLEINIGTDPLNDADLDGDGLSDSFEVCFDGDCTSYDPYDPTYGTGTDMDTMRSDTDGDGVVDFSEINSGTNPLNPSSFRGSGDVNSDGKVNVADVLLAKRQLLGFTALNSEQLANADIYPTEGDNMITLQDILLIQRMVISGP